MQDPQPVTDTPQLIARRWPDRGESSAPASRPYADPCAYLLPDAGPLGALAREYYAAADRR